MRDIINIENNLYGNNSAKTKDDQSAVNPDPGSSMKAFITLQGEKIEGMTTSSNAFTGVTEQIQNKEKVSDNNVSTIEEEQISENLKSDFEEVKQEKQLTLLPIIQNADQHKTSLLRSINNPEKYTEDPIAFMLNRVWNYDYKSPNDLVFGYKLPFSVVSQTNEWMKEIFGYLESGINPRIGGIDLITTMADRVSTRLGKSYSARIGQKNETLLLFWANQIFAEIFDEVMYNNPGGKTLTSSALSVPLNLTFDKNSSLYERNLPIIFATTVYLIKDKLNNLKDTKENDFPFMESLIESIGTVDPIDFVPKFSFETNLYINVLDRLKTFLDSTLDKTYTNNNNIFKPWVGSATLNINRIVNYENSPFFSPAAGIIEGVKNKVSPKEINKCKENNQKNETGLRFFYVEGNDDIIVNENIPKNGLGCDKDNAEEWNQAKNILLSINSLQTQRVNLEIPYMFSIQCPFKNIIPEQSKIEMTVNNPSNNRGIRSELIKRYIKFLTKLNDGDYLEGEGLYPTNYQQTIIGTTNKIIDSSASNRPDWGVEEFIKNINSYGSLVKQYETNKINYALSPFQGAFDIGIMIQKVNPLNTEVLQTVYVNTYQTGESRLYFGYDSSFEYYDSQINYGRQYLYRVKRLVGRVKSEYRYNFEIDLPNNQIFVELKSHKYKLNTIPLVSQFGITNFSYIDLRPTAPHMEVFPYRGINNEVALLFQKYSYGEGLIKELVDKKDLTKEDKEALEYTDTSGSFKLYFNQNIKQIKILSSTKKPETESDFELMDTVNVLYDGFKKKIQIEPNKKYYFASKAVSFTGLESNLSQIYSVELFDDGGTTFPIIEIINIGKEPQEKKRAKSFNSQFRIEPAILQQAPNLIKVEKGNNDVGYLEPQVFSKFDETHPAFKIRVTSKKTGKKVDFNIIYKKKLVADNDPKILENINKNDILMSYKIVNSSFIQNAISRGSSFKKGQTVLISKNFRYSLIFQGDGNLVLYDNIERIIKNGQSKPTPLWSTKTVGKGERLEFQQSDGNIVIYDIKDKAVWSSKTENTEIDQLFLTDQGSLVVTSENNGQPSVGFLLFEGKVLWLFHLRNTATLNFLILLILLRLYLIMGINNLFKNENYL